MLTLLVATLIGRFASGHMWIGAVITGVVELAVGAWLVKRGLMVAQRKREGAVELALAHALCAPARGRHAAAPNNRSTVARRTGFRARSRSTSGWPTDAGIRIGDRLVLSPTPGGPGDTVIVSALVARRADPSEVARAEYRVRMHLDELQSLIGYGDRADRFAIATKGGSSHRQRDAPDQRRRRSDFAPIDRATSRSRRRARFSS